jgi:hypothetical protein
MTNRIILDIEEDVAFADGHEFSGAGAYRRLKGRARFILDPQAPAQAGIVDIDKATRNADGLVECTADFTILKPADMTRSSQRLFFDYGNRGNKRAIQFFCDAPATNDPLSLDDAGNGYLFRRGHVVVFCAWQGDMLPGNGRMLLDVPVADGIIGTVRTEFIIDAPGTATMPLSGFASMHSYRATSLDPAKAQLTRRRYPDAPREIVKGWQFARIQTGAGLDGQGAEEGLVVDNTSIHMPGGFEPGFIYEIIYQSQDPLVLGLGFVAVRDFISHLRYGNDDAAGNLNPVGNGIEKAYCWGRSQTGRLIRESIYQGFNADAEGRRVFDGVLCHVAGGGRMVMNHRFVCTNDAAGQEFESQDKAADRFPFSYASTTDHLTGQTDALLRHPQTDPLVIHTQTGTEYWQRHGSLVHTDTKGNDLAQPDTVRVYFWSSSQHFANPNATGPATGAMAHLGNPVQTSMLFRAMLDVLDAWATHAKPPPDSRVPRRADATLVNAAQWHEHFPDIPGAVLPRGPASTPLFDHGAAFEDGLPSEFPPKPVDMQGYTTLVPAPDADGNDAPGVRVPMVVAPLGTYSGWNIRDRSVAGSGTMAWFNGSYMPFADTPEMRAGTRDPRPSIQERYGDKQGYQNAVAAAAHALVADGFMLEEDVERVIQRLADWGRPLSVVKLP